MATGTRRAEGVRQRLEDAIAGLVDTQHADNSHYDEFRANAGALVGAKPQAYIRDEHRKQVENPHYGQEMQQWNELSALHQRWQKIDGILSNPQERAKLSDSQLTNATQQLGTVMGQLVLQNMESWGIVFENSSYKERLNVGGTEPETIRVQRVAGTWEYNEPGSQELYQSRVNLFQQFTSAVTQAEMTGQRMQHHLEVGKATNDAWKEGVDTHFGGDEKAAVQDIRQKCQKLVKLIDEKLDHINGWMRKGENKGKLNTEEARQVDEAIKQVVATIEDDFGSKGSEKAMDMLAKHYSKEFDGKAKEVFANSEQMKGRL